jgi:pre-mRNA-splicing factor CWC22
MGHVHAPAQAIRREILGEDSEEEGDDDEDEDDDEEEDDEDEGPSGAAAGTQTIQDNTETNLINLRRTIYLTIMSALDFEEAGHKLMKIQLAPGQESEIATMIIECCSQEKTFNKCVHLISADCGLYGCSISVGLFLQCVCNALLRR